MDKKFIPLRFRNTNEADFVKELKRNVNRYFKENNISKYANVNMVFKSIFMIGLYVVPFVFILIGQQQFWVNLILWTIMAHGMAGIGLSIMHDANHGAYSKKNRVNNFFGFLVNFLGADHKNWKIQHNLLHHTYTNIDGYDEDIDTPWLRFSPEQKKSKWYTLQILYAPILYGLMTIFWFTAKDFIQLVRYHRQGLCEPQSAKLAYLIFRLAINKIWYIALILGLPMFLSPLPWYQTLGLFFIMHFICGLILAMIFQPAHVIQETEFLKPDTTKTVENNWAIHQLKTTANFANKSRIFSWLIGGLNYQIEHHLFPNICHVHYRYISKIVRETAQKFEIPYYEHKTFLGALKSHFMMIHRLGIGKI